MPALDRYQEIWFASDIKKEVKNKRLILRENCAGPQCSVRAVFTHTLPYESEKADQR